ncbi:MAG: ribonuclease HI family protein [Acidobacteria bacterium]|nr:MAG: ribonuclease HI family protein [Acidobacteriota bacterium]
MPSPSSELKHIIAHIDGGSRGNPGPAAYAVVVSTQDGTRLASFSRYLGHATNNVAEYEGLLAALDYALKNNQRRVKIITDSELLARQIGGQYKVRNPNLQVLHERARMLIAQFDAFRIEHVRREYNREADRLANDAMDSASKHKGQPQAPAVTSDPLRASATYHQGILELHGSPPLKEGERVDLKIERSKE